MTLGRNSLKNSPFKSPKQAKLANTSAKRRSLLKQLLNKDVQLGSSSKANLKVIVRVRPENSKEIESNARSIISIIDEHELIFDPAREEENFFFHGQRQNRFRDLNKKQNKEQKFSFERIYGPGSTNDQIFENTTKDIIDTVLKGYNCSVFAYGATGAGKTYTMIGSEENPGIIFLTVMELYKMIEELKDTKQCEVGVSYLEIYNEMVKDLLMPGKPLNLLESGDQVKVSGLSFHKPKDANDLLKILENGNRNRSQHPTDANSESSRSHAVFQVFVKQQDVINGLTSKLSIAKLSMIDLAGSERGAATGFKGERFREGANINRSLLALGNCINALADGKKHIPYRDSKLTRLLKDSLGGNCRSVMIAAISRSSNTFEDTFNTLRYASRAKTIKTKLKRNIVNVDQHVSQYVKIVEELQAQVISLKEKLKSFEEGQEQTFPSEELHKGPNSEDNVATAEETAMLQCLVNHNVQLKDFQKLALQIEISEREKELEIHLQRGKNIKMNLILFASKKMEKGIQKTERLVERLENDLNKLAVKKYNLQQQIQEKTREINETQESLKQFGPSGENLKPSAEEFIKHNKLEQIVRDYDQSLNYLKSVINKLMDERNHSEKLVILLLSVVKHFYLRLKIQSENSSNQSLDEESQQMFDNVVDMVDCTRIEWADLKNTDKSFSEQIIADLPTQRNSPMNVNKLVDLPNMHSMVISPFVSHQEISRRTSILKRKATTSLRRNVSVTQLISPPSTEMMLNETVNLNESLELPNMSLVNTPRCRNPLNATFDLEVSPPKKSLLSRQPQMLSIDESPTQCNSTFAISDAEEELSASATSGNNPSNPNVLEVKENTDQCRRQSPKNVHRMGERGLKSSFRSSKSSLSRMTSGFMRPSDKLLRKSTSVPSVKKLDSRLSMSTSKLTANKSSTSSLKRSASSVKISQDKENGSSSRASFGGRLYFPKDRTLAKQSSQRTLDFFKPEQK